MIHPKPPVELGFDLAPANDATGALGEVRAAWPGSHPRFICLLDGSGRVLVRWSAASDQPDPVLPRSLLTDSSSAVAAARDEQGAWHAATHRETRQTLVILSEDMAQERTESCLAVLKLLTPLAVLAWRHGDHAAMQDHRVEQLRKEQQSLHQRYVAANAEALEERDRSLAKEVQHCEQLEEQVAARSAELREALLQARLASRAKSDFLTNMSHEIRTPLNAMLGYCDLLLKQEPSDPTNRDWLAIIQRNGEHLLRLIEDVLDLTHIEGGSIQIKKAPCQPSAVIAATCDSVRPRCERKNLQLECDLPNPDAWMVTDPTRLQQILLNLMGNAVKFTDTGKVGVRARLHAPAPGERGQDQLVIEVYDTGVGMCAQMVERLFEPFEQADSSTTRAHGGTGVGLALSQRIARLMGGSIHCQSQPQVGTTMTLRLPMDRPASSSPAPPPAATPEPRVEAAAAAPTPAPRRPAVPNATTKLPAGTRVLVAEDGPDNRMLINLFLKSAGVTPVLVENGQLAVAAALDAQRQGQPFDIILMDMQMPVMDGYAAAGALRQAGFTVPIVAVTAHAMSGDRQRCLDAGCSDYLTKPIDRGRMVELMALLMQGHDPSTDA
jgi:signal transduction histidine kinase/ActR/RegA family two-component response regulator